MTRRILEPHVNEVDIELGDRNASATVSSSSGGPALWMTETIPRPNLNSRECSRRQNAPATSGGTVAAVASFAVATQPVPEVVLRKGAQRAVSVRAAKGAVSTIIHKRNSTMSPPPVFVTRQGSGSAERFDQAAATRVARHPCTARSQ
jgi:hypothetical protein